MSLPLDAASVAELLLQTAEAGGTAAGATVVGIGADAAGAAAAAAAGGSAGGRDLIGRRLVRIAADGKQETRGSLDDPELEAAIVDLLDEAMADLRAKDGLRRVAMDSGAEHPTVEVYLEIRRPIRELVVVGAGHIAQPMAHIGALLGYRVTVLDDRPDFATRERFPDAHRLVRADFSDPFAQVPLHERSHLLLVTRGHKYDYECLVRALRMDPAPAYIGMIGSRRRVRATYVQLLDEGVEEELIHRIHAPVGLDIGAETPEEIAVAVAAELVMLDRGGTGGALKDVERVAERFFGQAREEQEA